MFDISKTQHGQGSFPWGRSLPGARTFKLTTGTTGAQLHERLCLHKPFNGDDEHVGGRLNFTLADGLMQLPRPHSSATLHANPLVHDVSTLNSGVRHTGSFPFQKPPLLNYSSPKFC